MSEPTPAPQPTPEPTPATELASDWVHELARRVATATPARIFTGRSGTSYRTSTELRLRADHAAARDAVNRELDTSPKALELLCGGRPSTLLATEATSKETYLQRPDLGRRLTGESQQRLQSVRKSPDLQIVLGDGLSAQALTLQAPALLPLLESGARLRGWSLGDLLVIRHCRVGVMNVIGATLDARVVLLLIGERPGLATASSLSAYLGYRPREGHTDGDRNVVSNIHARGLAPELAADRILPLADAMVLAGTSGVAIKETTDDHDRMLMDTSEL